MGCIALVRYVLVLRCGLAVVVWYPYAGWGTACVKFSPWNFWIFLSGLVRFTPMSTAVFFFWTPQHYLRARNEKAAQLGTSSAVSPVSSPQIPAIRQLPRFSCSLYFRRPDECRNAIIPFPANRSLSSKTFLSVFPMIISGPWFCSRYCVYHPSR